MRLMTVLALLLAAGFASAGERLVLSVDGVEREALLFPPATETAGTVPVVFLFHGHGGTGAGFAGKFDLHAHWPEALIIAPQGLPTRTRNDPKGRRSGWFARLSDDVNRDLRFFDELLARVRSEYDVSQIYASGHSNGGNFAYFVAAARPGVFAAIAPSGAASRAVQRLEPLPVLHIAGKNDELVPIEAQQQLIAARQERNACSRTDETFGSACDYCASDNGTPVIACIHDGGHTFTPELVPTVTKFFRTTGE
jgi:polyhydroxybutyrate depolymerase